MAASLALLAMAAAWGKPGTCHRERSVAIHDPWIATLRSR